MQLFDVQVKMRNCFVIMVAMVLFPAAGLAQTSDLLAGLLVSRQVQLGALNQLLH